MRDGLLHFQIRRRESRRVAFALAHGIDRQRGRRQRRLRTVVGLVLRHQQFKPLRGIRQRGFRRLRQRAQQPFELSLRDRRAIEIRRVSRRNLELQCRPLGERLGDGRESSPARPASSAARARIELDEVHLLATAEQAAEQRERRRGGLGEEPDERLPDERPHAELRIVEAAASSAGRCR